MEQLPALRGCRRLGAPAAVLACAALLPGCFGVRGSGKASRDKRSLAPFKAIEVSGIVRVDATAGGPQSVTVSGDDNLVPLVVTDVHAGRLRIGTHKAVRPRLALVVHITAPEIDAASASGAAHITLRNIKDGKLELDADGAAGITASGSARDLALDLSGASTADAGRLKAATARVTASGSATAEVYASEWLEVHLSGAGRVRYGGNPPKIVKDISGAAALKKR